MRRKKRTELLWYPRRWRDKAWSFYKIQHWISVKRSLPAKRQPSRTMIDSMALWRRSSRLGTCCSCRSAGSSSSKTGPLAGVPVAIKDNMCTEGLLTTCSSKILANFVPTYTAEAVCNLTKAGAVILGKTNMDEFAMGSTTETSAFGVTRNPWNTEHVPGGSSGG